MNVLEILNSHPGETFLQEHARAIIEKTSVQLSWGFWQSDESGRLPKPVDGLRDVFGLINYNRLSRFRKLFVKGWRKNAFSEHLLIRQIGGLSPKPDVIHFHFASLAAKHYKVALALKIPYTFSVRGADIQTYPTTIAKYREQLKLAVKFASRIHCVSEDLKNELFTLYGANEKTKVIYTPVNSTWSKLELQPRKNELLAIGRLHWRKGLADLLLACKILTQKNISFNLKIVGEGELRDQLTYMIRDLNLNNNVELVGRKSHQEIRKLAEDTKLFVLTSWAEGVPNVLAEMMMAGVPFVATALPGIREILPVEYHDRLVSVADPEALADKIIEHIHSTSNAKTTIIANELFSYEKHSNNFVEFWKAALDGQ